MISPISGLDAINSVTQNSPFGATKSEPLSGDFAAVLSQAMQGVAQSVEKAEAMSIQGMEGKADVREVVDAVMAAERQMTAAAAIRDKITAAYLEISRMAI
ncbi:MAG: flagellar hook-basal body complex protein FliE [Pseudomonadota bacterium]